MGLNQSVEGDTMRIIFLLILFLCSLPYQSLAGSLKATMGEVLLRNLQPGATYHLTELMRFPLRLTYEGGQPITFKVTPVTPVGTEEGKEGYDSIPDPNWIQADPSRFDLRQSATVESNITISIPGDESLRGKKFIAYLSVETGGPSRGLAVGMGTKSRLLFSIAKEKVESSSVPAQSYMDFDLDPPMVRLSGIQPGKPLKLDKILRKEFYLHNFGREDKRFFIGAITGKSLEMDAPKGAEWGPEETRFQISPSNIKINAGKKKAFHVSMKIPDVPSVYGKKLHYILRVTPEGSGMTSGTLFRITAETVRKPAP